MVPPIVGREGRAFGGFEQLQRIGGRGLERAEGSADDFSHSLTWAHWPGPSVVNPPNEVVHRGGPADKAAIKICPPMYAVLALYPMAYFTGARMRHKIIK